ncbi:hypothetical protein PN36_09950 [Candidatus Thiomargarita nelsonii]|uniref:Uncharacterized protein n=1 Tax=Candidatus Thiomargarita nelsonii TaxID=1003181 RepID=A0A4E0R542_9GAMM|nr:hypothetical protein PN36_09950 [Candidatus Thiomargarita nelsonii]
MVPNKKDVYISDQKVASFVLEQVPELWINKVCYKTPYKKHSLTEPSILHPLATGLPTHFWHPP